MKKLLFFAGTLLTLTGCTVYRPQAVDIPLINHAGDTRVDASFSVSSWVGIIDAMNINATVSHGFNGWLTGQLHANYGGENWYAQAAPGVYLPMGDYGVAELYAGYGYGGADREDKDDRREHFAGHYHLPFVQLNVGLHDLLSSKLDLGVGLKVGGFLPDYQYHKFGSDGVEDLSKYEHYTTSNLLLEPQVMLRFGAPSFKFNVKVGVAWLSDFLNDSDNAHMIYDFITASCGFTFSF